MKEQLKNCPRCGGTLDDNGRCVYCNSKVYDLTDVNINVNSKDTLLLKLNGFGGTFVTQCYPVSVRIEMEPNVIDCVSIDGTRVKLPSRGDTRIFLELVSY